MTISTIFSDKKPGLLKLVDLLNNPPVREKIQLRPTTRKINFVEFIRSMEPTSVVLKHALRRRRPVIYSFAITNFVRYIANFFDKKYRKELNKLGPSSNIDYIERFYFEMAISCPTRKALENFAEFDKSWAIFA